MNTLTKHLLDQVLEAVQEAVNTNMVVCIMADSSNDQSGIWTCEAADYWQDPAGFEKAVFIDADRSPFIRGVFVAPVISSPDDDLMVRPNDHDLSPGETEQLLGIAFDFTEGVDVVSLPIGRRPNGEAVFGEGRTATSPVELSELMPGFGVYTRMLTPTG